VPRFKNRNIKAPSNQPECLDKQGYDRAVQQAEAAIAAKRVTLRQ